MLTIAICDDDTFDINDELRMLEQVMPRFEVGYSIDTYTTADEMLASEKLYYIVFLDVEMEGLNGIKAAETIHKKNKDCLIFFVTNHENYMDEALNKHAFRFWTKPINKARLIYGIKSAILEVGSRVENIPIPLGRETINISSHEIICVFHLSRKTHIITTSRNLETYAPYKSITDMLTQSYFYETDKNCTVNLNYVSDYTKNDILCRHDGEIFKASLSRRKYKGFDARFKEWSGEKR